METFYNIKVLEYYWRLALHLTSFFFSASREKQQAGKVGKNRKVYDVITQVLSRGNGLPDCYCSQVM